MSSTMFSGASAVGELSKGKLGLLALALPSAAMMAGHHSGEMGALGNVAAAWATSFVAAVALMSMQHMALQGIDALWSMRHAFSGMDMKGVAAWGRAGGLQALSATSRQGLNKLGDMKSKLGAWRAKKENGVSVSPGGPAARANKHSLG